MANCEIEVAFFGTGNNVSDYDGEIVKIGSKKFSNIRRKKSNRITRYSFSGPGILDLGNTNIANNVRNGVALLTNVIDHFLSENNDDSEIRISVSGHSRGGVAATLVVNKLKKLYAKNKRVKFVLRVSDPYAGPTHSGEKVSVNLEQNTDAGSEGLGDVVFYSMGTAFRVSPQKIINAYIVCICEEGHFHTEGYMVDAFAGQKDVFFKATKDGGAFLLQRKQGGLIITKITKQNLKEVMDIIYAWKNSYTARTRLLTEIIAKMLKLRVDDILETGAVREWNTIYPETLRRIRQSTFLRNAFIIVFNLFSDNLFGPYINKEGRFFRCLRNARSAVVGLGNNDYETALDNLQIIINSSKQEYKKRLANALAERIKKYYNLP